MHSTLEIAIIDPNTLAALGLRTILEEMLPETIVRTFSSYAALMDDTPDMYAHYFVSSHIYFEHTAFFLERRPKTIVLTTGEVSLPVPTLDISLPQDILVARIVNLRQHGHEHHTRPASDASADEQGDSRPPSHRAHHRDISPAQHQRQARHTFRLGPGHLCRHARAGRGRQHLNLPTGELQAGAYSSLMRIACVRRMRLLYTR